MQTSPVFFASREAKEIGDVYAQAILGAIQMRYFLGQQRKYLSIQGKYFSDLKFVILFTVLE